jgi:hypothetical protein
MGKKTNLVLQLFSFVTLLTLCHIMFVYVSLVRGFYLNTETDRSCSHRSALSGTGNKKI